MRQLLRSCTCPLCKGYLQREWLCFEDFRQECLHELLVHDVGGFAQNAGLLLFVEVSHAARCRWWFIKCTVLLELCSTGEGIELLAAIRYIWQHDVFGPELRCDFTKYSLCRLKPEMRHALCRVLRAENPWDIWVQTYLPAPPRHNAAHHDLEAGPCELLDMEDYSQVMAKALENGQSVSCIRAFQEFTAIYDCRYFRRPNAWFLPRALFRVLQFCVRDTSPRSLQCGLLPPATALFRWRCPLTPQCIPARVDMCPRHQTVVAGLWLSDQLPRHLQEESSADLPASVLVYGLCCNSRPASWYWCYFCVPFSPYFRKLLFTAFVADSSEDNLPFRVIRPLQVVWSRYRLTNWFSVSILKTDPLQLLLPAATIQ